VCFVGTTRALFNEHRPPAPSDPSLPPPRSLKPLPCSSPSHHPLPISLPSSPLSSHQIIITKSPLLKTSPSARRSTILSSSSGSRHEGIALFLTRTPPRFVRSL
jgi:hypothetical protein